MILPGTTITPPSMIANPTKLRLVHMNTLLPQSAKIPQKIARSVTSSSPYDVDGKGSSSEIRAQWRAF